MTSPVCTREGFPHGLRCADCNKQIRDGQPYSERPDSFIGVTPVVALICLDCADPKEDA